jgi:excisionase family DNA binding protein
MTSSVHSIQSYSIATVAEILGVSERHIEKEIKRGELRAWRIGRRGVRVTESSLLEYVRRRTLMAEGVATE